MAGEQHPVHHSHTAGAGQGPVAVEVGSGVGALLLWTGPEMDGAELDITPVGHDARRRHVAVLARRLPQGVRTQPSTRC